MKVQKTSTQPAFQPIELKITIESQEELHDLLVLSSLSSEIRGVLSSLSSEIRGVLSSLSSEIRGVLSNICLDYDSATTLKRLLDNIGDCL